MKIIVFFLAMIGISALNLAALVQEKPLETVPSVDLQKYMGKWYEIASFPQRFQKGCNCTTAEYEMTDKGYVRVINTCRKNSPDGKISRASGKAFVVEGTNNAKLKVQFFWPFRGDYWIIDLAQDYSYAVVGDQSRKYLWILSRSPNMDESLYQEIVQRCAGKSFDVSKLQRTVQTCAER